MPSAQPTYDLLPEHLAKAALLLKWSRSLEEHGIGDFKLWLREELRKKGEGQEVKPTKSGNYPPPDPED